jgi:predicted DNA-binding protein (MmcQ/YjbR family)
MNIEQAIAVGLSLPSAERTYPFGPTTAVLKVGGKVFALLREDENPGRITLKCEPWYATALVAEHGAITPGYHMNKRHWITIALQAGAPDTLVTELIEDSYDVVAASLPARLKPEWADSFDSRAQPGSTAALAGEPPDCAGKRRRGVQ